MCYNFQEQEDDGDGLDIDLDVADIMKGYNDEGN
jgi:hypothetical protein